MNILSPDLTIALEAARAGAKEIRQRFGNASNPRVKDEAQTLVTDTDLAAEAAILKVLRNHSSYGILSEESGQTGDSTGPCWIVDPLDGTSNFARLLPLFAVSVALVEGTELRAGVIIDPFQQKEYSASAGDGAFCNGKPLHTTKNTKPVSALFLNHGHRQPDKTRYAEINVRLATDFSIRKLGTTALELCYVAAGLFDGFICSGDEIWDYVAGALIATEAGCIFTDWKGRPWDGKNNFVLISKPEIHGKLVEETKDLQPL